ncbi:MAG: tRNA (N(6)-L-threonylcarbamoyladenosine(37)-C(2))-methylthiotransferase MtaB [Eubacteriales bacterium]|nr:tRNA (N(6)-L-threonylcarbamoyladenosine(37)-C(2))-methylthiotransferase MtaB [Eubacteriales bacterium]
MKFAIHTLGCKVNTYESDLMVQELKARGHEEVAFDEKADVYIINTCTVTNIADRKSRQMLHRARKLNPDATIVAAGCYVDSVIQGKGIEEPEVDIWVSNKDKGNIADIIEGREGEGTQIMLTELDGHTRAFLKIEDGCNQFCSYCIIPYVRGRVTKRDPEDTVREVVGLAERGITEVVLTGIHLSSLGDVLMQTIAGINAVPGIKRIRLGSLEPRLITGEFIAELKRYEKVCPHFHLSLQSGSDEILKKMNRHYTSAEFLEGVRIIRETWPLAAITTDIIVGFPGETEENFEESLEFAKTVGFYEAHVFKYSRRKGTVADKMDGQLTEAVKGERSKRLIEACEQLSHEYRLGYLGNDAEFLYEETIEHDGRKYLTGYTREYVRCIKEAIGEAPLPGEIINGAVKEICNVKGMDEALLLV